MARGYGVRKESDFFRPPAHDLLADEHQRADMAAFTRRELLAAAAMALVSPGVAQAVGAEPYLSDVTALSWAAADAATGRVLASHEPDTRRKSASITKIMTALLVAEYAELHPGALDETVVFSAAAVRKSGTRTGLRAGERMSVLDTLYGLMLPSGNDAGWALAEHFGDRLGGEGTDAVGRFIDAMNRRAVELDMKRTIYRSPFGDGGTAQARTTTAGDLLVLARSAMAQPLVAAIVATRTYAVAPVDADGGKRYLAWANRNRMLAYPEASGIKTGTTTAAGACVVTEILVDRRKVHIVVLGSKDDEQRYVDTQLIIAWLMWAKPA